MTTPPHTTPGGNVPSVISVYCKLPNGKTMVQVVPDGELTTEYVERAKAAGTWVRIHEIDPATALTIGSPVFVR